MKNNVTFEGAKVFRKEYDGRASYSVGVSGKKFENGHQLDEYVTAYLNANFPRGNAPSDKAMINITRAFLTTYEDREGKAHIKLVVLEWEDVSEYSWGM